MSLFVLFWTDAPLFPPLRQLYSSHHPANWPFLPRRIPMSASDTALIVVDVQESFRQRPYWNDADVPAFLHKQQALIDGAKARGIPVAQIFHVEDDGVFALAS